MKKPKNSSINNSTSSKKESKEEAYSKNSGVEDIYEEGNIMTIGEDRGGDEDSELVEGGYDDGGYFVE